MRYQAQNDEPMNRRQFLIVTAASVAGLAIAPLFENAAEAQGRTQSVANHMFELAEQMGFRKSRLLAEEYLPLVSAPVQRHIKLVNDMMKKGHFPHLEQSNVCRVDDLFFYTAIHEDNFNACAAFFSKSGGARTLMEGPTLVGLNLAAQQLKQQEGYTSTECRDLLYPFKLNSRSVGTFQKGYLTPDDYQTQNGKVTIKYVNSENDSDRKSGEGIITVTAVRDRRGDRRVVLDEQNFAVTYKYA